MTDILKVKSNGEWVGIPAIKGETGEGVIPGGTTGQALIKKTNTDYDTEWKNVGTVTSINNVSPVNGNVTLTIPSEVTESTVSGWGFTKNSGTVTSVNNVSPVNGNVTLSIPTVNDNTITITQGGVTKGTFTLNQSSGDTIALDAGGGGSSRNIGEIVTSTIPLTDAGLHLLDGSLLVYGSYQAFIDYIADLYDSGDYTDIFETEANWQTAVTTYGVCGKFVYDSTNNTVRLPKYNSKIYTGGGNAPVIGDGNALGLTDGTSNAGLASYSNSTLETRTGNYGVAVGTSNTGSNLSASKAIGVTTDGTKSGIIADLTNITTSLDGYYYIVIANSTKTAIEVDIDEIATDLNGKADIDLSNINPTQTAKDTIIGWGLPDYSSGIDLTVSSLPYEAPSAGFIVGTFVVGSQATNGRTLLINNSVLFALPGGNWRSFSLLVQEGDTLSTYIDSVGFSAVFYPLKGV